MVLPVSQFGIVGVVFQAAAAHEQKLVVVSVSPQSRASLAARCKLGLLETAQKLTMFLKSLGKCGAVLCPPGFTKLRGLNPTGIPKCPKFSDMMDLE